MATARTIDLDIGQWTPQFYRPGVSKDSTTTASKLLQENHERHEIFFNAAGFHNHIAHHTLTLWALKASPKDLERNYDVNASYQRPARTIDSSVIKDMHDPQKLKKYLGKRQHYNDFLEFFEAEMESKGWPTVVNDYIFEDTGMLLRLFSGILHPLIHLGFGIEFHQPAVIAEALAQTACYGPERVESLLLGAEEAAKKQDKSGSESTFELIDDILEGKQPRNDVLCQVHVHPDQLEEKTAEMINGALSLAASSRRNNKFDFYAIHNANASIFFPSFMRQEWLSTKNKVRMLEWKIRLDLSAYSRLSSRIDVQGIRDYKPKKPSDWDGVIDRACRSSEDGHNVKFIRALANGEQVCRPYKARDDFILKNADFLQLAHIAIDSIEKNGDGWTMF